MQRTSPAVSDQLLQRIAARLKAMGNPVRLKILHALEHGELSVTEIVARVGVSQANVSKHLNTLRAADLVECRREGLSVCYRISDAAIFEVCRTVCDSLLERARGDVESIVRGRAVFLARAGQRARRARA